MKHKLCSTCKNPDRKVFFRKECNICRQQWKAYYAGKTPVSPLMRAIEADKAEKYVNS